MTHRVLAVCLAATAATAAQAQASAPSPPDDAEEAPAPPETRWYGWQVLLADAASGALIYFGAKGDNTPLAVAGVATFFLAAPAIHLAHGSGGDAGKSFLFRTVPLAVGFGIAAIMASGEDCGEGCAALLPAFAGLVGSGLGAIADWLFLSTEPVSPPRLSIGPALPMDRRRGGGLALTLRF